MQFRVRIRTWASPCQICGEKSGTVTGFSQNTSVVFCHYQFHHCGHTSTDESYALFENRWSVKKENNFYWIFHSSEGSACSDSIWFGENGESYVDVCWDMLQMSTDVCNNTHFTVGFDRQINRVIRLHSRKSLDWGSERFCLRQTDWQLPRHSVCNFHILQFSPVFVLFALCQAANNHVLRPVSRLQEGKCWWSIFWCNPDW